MRVIMVAWSFYPRVGGSVTCVRGLSGQLITRGIEVEIIAPLLREDLGKKEELDLDKRVRIHWVTSPFARSYTDFYSRLVFFFKFISKIRSLSASADIFHAQDFNVSFLSTIIGTKKPVAVMFGADPLFEMVYFKKKECPDYRLFLSNGVIIALRRIIRALITAFSGKRLIIVSPCESVNQIIGKFTPAPVVNIPVGINLELFRKDKAGNARQSNMLLVVARFVCWKGIDLSIDVFRQVKKQNPQTKIVFIGGGPLGGYYLNKYKNLDGVRFIIDLDYKETVEYFKKASVLLVTSKYETLGNNITEAMAAGLPVVATDLDVFHDRLIDGINCYLVKDGNALSFSDRVLTLMGDPQTRERFAAGALAAAADYDIHKVSDRYIDLYKSMINGKT